MFFLISSWDNNNSPTNKSFKNCPTVAHIVIHNGGNDSHIHRNLKYYIQNFKTSLNNTKIWNQHIAYFEENKFRG